jgi:DNA helicase-2/ATP-dependent DNA helicase PcrA
MRSVELLQRVPEVKKRIQQRFRFVLVDEYQDANTAQFLLLKELYHPENYLCVVGDEDQSIYRFRGADVHNILRFSEAFSKTQIIRLEQNYRSTQNILEAASRVVENNRERLGKNLWSDAGPGRFIGLAVVGDEREEALLCAKLLDNGDLEDTAILYRNNYQSRIFETVFSRLHIPFRLIGSLRFAEREEVKDGLAYAGFVLNQNDEVSFMRIVNKPSRGIGRTSLEKILAHWKSGRSGGDYLEACRAVVSSLTGRAGKGLAHFIEMVDSLRSEVSQWAPAEFFHKMLNATGLYEHYREKDRMEETNRTQNLDELVNAAMGYPRGLVGLSEFLESLELNSTDEDPYERKHAVNLITMHNTKGLEFSRVVVTGMEDGLIPFYREDVEEDVELEEERRLFYVAMTRAKSDLILTACRRRQVFGMYKNRRLSRFLSEIPQHLLTPLTPDSMEPWNEDEDSELTEGCGVYHAQYGPGVITRKWHDGKHTLVTAHFSSGKTGKFILKYADLERISLDD